VKLTDVLIALALFLGITRQEFVHTYDKSAYQVRLELAMEFYAMGDPPEKAFAKADEFISYLKTLKK
jgi:hypothetical protein